MAESAGFELARDFRLDGLANRCLNHSANSPLWKSSDGLGGGKGPVTPDPPVQTDPLQGGILGGGKGTRTPDPLLAKQVLSQLSYTPTREKIVPSKIIGWGGPATQAQGPKGAAEA